MLIAVHVERCLGFKLNMVLSSLFCTFWILCYLLPSYRRENNNETGIFSDTAITIVVIISAICIGLSAGTLRSSAGKYVAECATDENKGIYSGIFLAM